MICHFLMFFFLLMKLPQWASAENRTRYLKDTSILLCLCGHSGYFVVIFSNCLIANIKSFTKLAKKNSNKSFIYRNSNVK